MRGHSSDVHGLLRSSQGTVGQHKMARTRSRLNRRGTGLHVGKRSVPALSLVSHCSSGNAIVARVNGGAELSVRVVLVLQETLLAAAIKIMFG